MTQYFLYVDNFCSLSKQAQKETLIEACARIGIDKADAITASNNLTLFHVFCHKAFSVRNAGRDHYSARTIIEVIRHETVLADNDRTFKINNNIAPVLAKLSMELFPFLNNLFSTRGASKNVNP